MTARGVAYIMRPEQPLYGLRRRKVIVSGRADGSPAAADAVRNRPATRTGRGRRPLSSRSPHTFGKNPERQYARHVLFRRPVVGVAVNEVGLSLGTAALRDRRPAAARSADDDKLPPRRRLEAEAERRIADWATTVAGVVPRLIRCDGSSRGDLPDHHTTPLK